MLIITEVVRPLDEHSISNQLHALEHENCVEVLQMDPADTLRRRWRGTTDKGTEVILALDGASKLEDGAVLFLDRSRAIVLRTSSQRWLRITLRDADAAVEVGYCAGNHHWRVRFKPGEMHIAVEGDDQRYVAALAELLSRRSIGMQLVE